MTSPRGFVTCARSIWVPMIVTWHAPGHGSIQTPEDVPGHVLETNRELDLGGRGDGHGRRRGGTEGTRGRCDACNKNGVVFSPARNKNEKSPQASCLVSGFSSTHRLTPCFTPVLFLVVDPGCFMPPRPAVLSLLHVRRRTATAFAAPLTDSTPNGTRFKKTETCSLPFRTLRSAWYRRS